MPKFIVIVQRKTHTHVTTTQLPQEHNSAKSAWDTVEWLKCGGDIWVDHEDIHSRPVLVDYRVKQVGVA